MAMFNSKLFVYQRVMGPLMVQWTVQRKRTTRRRVSVPSSLVAPEFVSLLKPDAIVGIIIPNGHTMMIDTVLYLYLPT
jgi:hypothetical protein